MDKPKRFPIAHAVEAGQLYYWCSCGETASPPFCDGDDCGDKKITYRACYSETLLFCTCTETAEPPLCDGSHLRLFSAALNTKTE
ncbi:MAG: CDGSH iron-sulfur domain-containing protein [Legionellaceae bacterium]|nr:CDGSH iron-sulfur domain-containing protein [Legionellaceae bacterium]